MNEGSVELRGSCLCGGVRFEVTEPFVTVRYCHCASCKKLSVGAGTVNGRISPKAIRLLAGDGLLRTFQPAEGSSKTFCSECGSNVFGGGWPTAEIVSVRLSTLDSPFDRKPESHNFVRSVAAWEVLPDDGAPRFDTRAP
jgi:hypothetical protein